MSEKFQVGDVVRLKSGGQTMTIEEIGDDDNISCVWFQGTEVKRAPFVSATLKEAGTPGISSIPLGRR